MIIYIYMLPQRPMVCLAGDPAESGLGAGARGAQSPAGALLRGVRHGMGGRWLGKLHHDLNFTMVYDSVQLVYNYNFTMVYGIYGNGSKPWHLVNIKIDGKWMFINPNMAS